MACYHSSSSCVDKETGDDSKQFFFLNKVLVISFIVLKDGKLALLSSTNCFMSIRDEDDSVIAMNRQAGSREMCWVRTQKHEEINKRPELPPEEKGSVADIELNYVYEFK